MWSSIVSDMQDSEVYVRPCNMSAADKRLLGLLCPSTESRERNAAWADYQRQVEAGWEVHRNLALTVRKESLDDSDDIFGLQEGKAKVSEGKAKRAAAREEGFAIIVDDAKNQAAARRMQVEVTQQMLTILQSITPVLTSFASVLAPSNNSTTSSASCAPGTME